MRVVNTETFIEKSISVHGDLYDYSCSQYLSSQTPIKIKCEKHGVFTQRPNDHLKGQGCPECSPTKKVTEQEFISILRLGDNVAYKKGSFKSMSHKVTLICGRHGDYSLMPKTAIDRPECRECAKEEKSKDLTAWFIREAKKVHGNDYEYTGDYLGPNNKAVVIRCKEHGDFLQSKNNHLNGNGCPKCRRKGGLSAFIGRARKIHGDRYDYSKSVYAGNANKIEIICREHGSFWMTVDNHIHKKQNCPKCKNANIRSMSIERLYVYCVTSNHDGGVMKVGISKDMKSRMKGLTRSTPFDITHEVTIELETNVAYAFESLCHCMMKLKGYKGFSGASEWGEIDRGLIELIASVKINGIDEFKRKIYGAFS